MNLILFGPPGAGKGTQAQYLVKKYSYYQLSTGDLLRNEIESKTNIGNQISEIIGRGEMVTDNIVDNLILNKSNFFVNKEFSKLNPIVTKIKNKNQLRCIEKY